MVFKFIIFLFPITLLAEIGYVEPWGKEVKIEISKPPPKKSLSPMGLIAEKMILLHRNAITHISGPRSHFRPSSSEYMLEAIRSFGFFKGYLMGCDRLLRENGESWIYRTRIVDDKLYKWDPPHPESP